MKYVDYYCKKVAPINQIKSNIVKNNNMSKKMRMAKALTISGSSKRIISRLSFNMFNNKK